MDMSKACCCAARLASVTYLRSMYSSSAMTVTVTTKRIAVTAVEGPLLLASALCGLLYSAAPSR